MKKEKSADVIWRGFDVICVLCPLTDRDQQLMKMHTEVTLLYNLAYTNIIYANVLAFEANKTN